MIKHHPSDELLTQFAEGRLPASINVAVSIHVEMCSCCQEKLVAINEHVAQEAFAVSDVTVDDVEMDSIFEQITADETLEKMTYAKAKSVNVAGKDIVMPRVLNQLEFDDWKGIGKLARSRVGLDDGDIRSSLLHIDAGGEIPHHTHTGDEVTVLLDGSFEDELGTYNKGDFIWLSGEHHHQPVTEKGCLCYAVVTDALHFNQGISRLLNPIGKLIY
jgi:putative transcriptional regulator